MSNLWVTFSTDSSGSFTELSGNIIYNLNNLYNFNGNLVDTTSDFIIYELSNNPIQGGVSLQPNNWKQLNLNTILNPFQGYWLGGINTKRTSNILNIDGYYYNTVGNYISNQAEFYNDSALDNIPSNSYIFVILSKNEISEPTTLESKDIYSLTLNPTNPIKIKNYIQLSNNFNVDTYYYVYTTDTAIANLLVDSPTEEPLTLQHL